MFITKDFPLIWSFCLFVLLSIQSPPAAFLLSAQSSLDAKSLKSPSHSAVIRPLLPLRRLSQDVDCPLPFIPFGNFHPVRLPDVKHHVLNHHLRLAPVDVATQEAPRLTWRFLTLFTSYWGQSAKYYLCAQLKSSASFFFNSETTFPHVGMSRGVYCESKL